MDNKENLYKAVNYLNSTKFKINSDLLNLILNEGKSLLDSININDSEILQNEITINIAKTYLNTPFYLNTYAD
jgi:hypothetical protein